MIYGVFKQEGRTIWRNLRTTDREQAKGLLPDEIKKAKRLDLKLSRSLTLEGLLDLFDETLAGFAPGTAENRRCLVNTFRRTWQFGLKSKIADIKTAYLRAWLAKHHGRLTGTTWNAYLRFLRGLFDLAVEAQAITDNPARTIKPLRSAIPVRRSPTWREFNAILRDVRKQKYSARARESGDLIEFMGTLGLGQAEVANLRGEHFDFARRLLTVFRQKTNKAFVIPIYPQAFPLLQRLRAEGRIANGK